MALNCKVRRAEFEDAAAMLDVFQACDLHAASHPHTHIALLDVMDWLESMTDTHPILIAEQDQQILAWCSIEPFYGLPAFDQAAEISLYVLPDWQGIGVGKALLESLLDARAQIGFVHLVAYIYASNHNSLRFFAANGFEQWGKLPNIARSPHGIEDVYLLGREFAPLSNNGLR
ncbi:N-acetyltransferase family protein [Marinomonas sp. THO17]|uniref:GNAT family N-acetyltransferase n=1 Tax=Marinomonas sp. THO17 TaxID=3149048 RepID=UPI00336BF784